MRSVHSACALYSNDEHIHIHTYGVQTTFKVCTVGATINGTTLVRVVPIVGTTINGTTLVRVVPIT